MPAALLIISDVVVYRKRSRGFTNLTRETVVCPRGGDNIPTVARFIPVHLATFSRCLHHAEIRMDCGGSCCFAAKLVNLTWYMLLDPAKIKAHTNQTQEFYDRYKAALSAAGRAQFRVKQPIIARHRDRLDSPVEVSRSLVCLFFAPETRSITFHDQIRTT